MSRGDVSMSSGSNNLLLAIPGLARHQVAPVAPVAPQVVTVDTERIWRLLQELQVFLGDLYPIGAAQWLAENRPDILGFFKQCEREMDAAIEAANLSLLVAVMGRYREAHGRAVKLFESRPPVIEVDRQGGLF